VYRGGAGIFGDVGCLGVGGENVGNGEEVGSRGRSESGSAQDGARRS
jgi:hypothetical protein